MLKKCNFFAQNTLERVNHQEKLILFNKNKISVLEVEL